MLECRRCLRTKAGAWVGVWTRDSDAASCSAVATGLSTSALGLSMACTAARRLENQDRGGGATMGPAALPRVLSLPAGADRGAPNDEVADSGVSDAGPTRRSGKAPTRPRIRSPWPWTAPPRSAPSPHRRLLRGPPDPAASCVKTQGAQCSGAQCRPTQPRAGSREVGGAGSLAGHPLNAADGRASHGAPGRSLSATEPAIWSHSFAASTVALSTLRSPINADPTCNPANEAVLLTMRPVRGPVPAVKLSVGGFNRSQQRSDSL